MRLAKEACFALENFSAMQDWNPETLFRRSNEVGPMMGMSLDPSHLISMGADPIASARVLGAAIHHCCMDTRIKCGRPKLKDVTNVPSRSWNCQAVGAGRNLEWWKVIFPVVRMSGYKSWESLETEDVTMSTDLGIRSAFDAPGQD